MLVCFITCCQKYTQIYYKKLKCIKTYGDTQRTSVRPPRLGGMETGAQVLGGVGAVGAACLHAVHPDEGRLCLLLPEPSVAGS